MFSTLALASVMTVQSLSFLSGTWKMEETDPAGVTHVIESHYSDPSGDIVLGQGRFIDGGVLSFYEFETFAVEQGALVLKPMPMGAQGVTFKATLVEENHVVFENADNAFPSIIEYRLNSDGSLYSRAAGTQDGAALVYEYVQTRTGN